MPDAENPAATSARAARILLVDDDPLTRGVLRRLLTDAGFTAVREAGDGEAALKMAAHFRPDLVCLDLFMPGLSGLEVLGQLTASQPGVIVVMLTATRERETVESCIRAGARGYIIKPFNSGRVIEIVERLLAAR